MKKTIRTILYAAVFAVLAVSCQKEINGVEPETNTKETIEISINGLMGEYTQVDATKSELVNTVRVSWKAGDVVYVYDGAQCLGSLIASLDGTEDRYALLSTDDTHTVSAPASGTKLTLVHSPLLTEAPAVSEGAISISLASQSGTKAPFVAYATLDYTGTIITNAVVPFKFATSVIKVNCTGLTANTAIDNATLSNVNTACKLTLSGTAAPTVSGSTNGTITRTGDEYFAAAKINAEGEAVFQIAVPALESASEARVLTVAQGSDKVKDKKFTTKSLDPATSVNTVCQLFGPPAGALAGVFTVGPNATDKVYFSQGNLYWDGSEFKFEANQYDFRTYAGKQSCIDGTSSDNGTPTGHWGLFGWVGASSSFTGGAQYGVSTSTTYSDYGNVASEALKSDWGNTIDNSGTWSTLSTAEWQYLFSYDGTKGGIQSGTNYDNVVRRGKYKYGVTVCGKANCLVIAPDDWNLTTHPLQSSYGTESSEGNPMTWEQAEAKGLVCLPAAGSRIGSNVLVVGDYGYYWSSTAFDGDSDYACSVSFDSHGVNPGYKDCRNIGFSVRLITESKE